MTQMINERRPHQLPGGRRRVGRIAGLTGLRAGCQIHTAANRFAAATPSASAWWILPTTAMRSLARPSTKYISHSG